MLSAKLAQVLKESKEDELLISKDLLEECHEVAKLAESFLEHRRAIANGTVNAKLLGSLKEFWQRVIPRPAPPMSEQGLTLLVKNAIARARNSVPPTVSLPADGTLEVAMSSLLDAVKDVHR